MDCGDKKLDLHRTLDDTAVNFHLANRGIAPPWLIAQQVVPLLAPVLGTASLAGVWYALGALGLAPYYF